MNSAQLVQKKIRDLTITEKAFFTSNALRGYLRNMLTGPCRSIKRNVPSLVLKWDVSPESFTAYTDDRQIVLNGGHPRIKKMTKTRANKVRYLIGLMVHEYGHYRFTDFAGMTVGQNRIQAGHFYPPIKEADLSPELADNKAAFDDYALTHTKMRGHIVSVWHHIDNILEDAYIEECLYHTVSGQLIDGLDYKRRRDKTLAPSVKELLEDIENGKIDMMSAVFSLLFFYAKYGSIRCDFKNPDEANSAPMQWLKKVCGYADDLLTESSTARRLNGINYTFLTLWPIIRDALDKAEKEAQDAEELAEALKEALGAMGSSAPKGGGEGTSPVSVSEEEDTGKSGSAKARKRTAKALGKSGEESEEEKGSSSKGTGASGEESSSEGEEASGSGSGSGADAESESESSSVSLDTKTRSSGEEASSRDSGEVAEAPRSEEEGEVSEPDDESFDEEDMEDGSYDESELLSAVSRLEKEIREEIAVETVNKELTKELKDELAHTDFGAAHRGLSVSMHRIGAISEETIDLYNQIAKPIEEVADTMVRKILPLIKKDTNTDMPMGGFFSGGKFDAARLVSNDWRYFRQNATPSPDTRLAISVLVDESGSMSSRHKCEDGTTETRISTARTAAMALYLFCQKAGIKCSVIGHSADQKGYGSMQLYAYADYETPDKNDKYRLLSISSKSNNRDGAAILFTGEHLLKREEPTKLLIIISDGAPAADGYYGVAAENDMANIVNELRRKGVMVFAAAIGMDKENIHRIYGSGFIDITNLKTLPDQLLQLVKRYIR